MCTFAVKFVLQLPIYNFLGHTAVVETSINKIGLLWNTNVFLRKEMYFWVKINSAFCNFIAFLLHDAQ